MNYRKQCMVRNFNVELMKKESTKLAYEKKIDINIIIIPLPIFQNYRKMTDSLQKGVTIQ